MHLININDIEKNPLEESLSKISGNIELIKTEVVNNKDFEYANWSISQWSTGITLLISFASIYLMAKIPEMLQDRNDKSKLHEKFFNLINELKEAESQFIKQDYNTNKLFEKITTELGKQPNEYDWIPGISNLEGTFVTERYKLIESIYTYDRAIVAFAYFLCEEKSYKNKIGNEYKDWRQVGYETLKDAYKELKLFFNRVQEGQENKKQPIFLPTLDYVINSKCLKPSEPYFLRLLSLKNKKIVPVFLKTTIRPLVKHRINSLKKTYKRIFKKKKNEKNERKLSEFEVFQNKINKHLKTHTLDAKDDQIYWIPNLKRLKNKFPRAA